MTKELESQIERLNQLSNKAYGLAMKYPKVGKKKGLALYYYGRCIECFMGVKTLLFSLNYSSKKGTGVEFAISYIDDLPECLTPRDIKTAQRYLSGTHTALRFMLFQNFYSQTEFTFKIIQRALHPDPQVKSNPFNLIAIKYGIIGVDNVAFLNDLRNTIHNNGYYFPDVKKSDKEYTFLGTKYKFVQGKPLLFPTMDIIFDICDYTIDETSKLFEYNPLLAQIEFN